MTRLHDDPTTPPDDIVKAAVLAARCSTCAKSKRGAAVFDVNAPGRSLGTGYNSMPYPFRCGGACGESCGKLCVHAEQRAVRAAQLILDVYGPPSSPDALEIVHVKILDGVLVAGGGPSCWQCSRAILEAGISGIWLYEVAPPPLARPPAWRRYSAVDFQLATARACALSGWKLAAD